MFTSCSSIPSSKAHRALPELVLKAGPGAQALLPGSGSQSVPAPVLDGHSEGALFIERQALTGPCFTVGLKMYRAAGWGPLPSKERSLQRGNG